MRTIRRYSNRKLYDTKESRYTTLEELRGLIASGETIKVVDGKPGTDARDITSKTLAQIVFTTMGDKLSQRGFHDLIRRGNKGFSVERFKDQDAPGDQRLDGPSDPSRSAFNR